MHMAASVREACVIYKSFSLKTRINPKLATAVRYLIYKHSTFLHHKVTHSKFVMVTYTLETILNEKVDYHFCQAILLFRL